MCCACQKQPSPTSGHGQVRLEVALRQSNASSPRWIMREEPLSLPATQSLPITQRQFISTEKTGLDPPEQGRVGCATAEVDSMSQPCSPHLIQIPRPQAAGQSLPPIIRQAAGTTKTKLVVFEGLVSIPNRTHQTARMWKQLSLHIST